MRPRELRFPIARSTVSALPRNESHDSLPFGAKSSITATTSFARNSVSSMDAAVSFQLAVRRVRSKSPSWPRSSATCVDFVDPDRPTTHTVASTGKADEVGARYVAASNGTVTSQGPMSRNASEVSSASRGSSGSPGKMYCPRRPSSWVNTSDPPIAPPACRKTVRPSTSRIPV
jgi:hypothetical protein